MNKPKTKAIDNRNETIACLAFFPLTGVLGIHDILLGEYWKFILRIALLILTRWMPAWTGIIWIFATLSYGWAFIEGLTILQGKNINKIPRKVNRVKKQNSKGSEENSKKWTCSVVSFILAAILLILIVIDQTSLRVDHLMDGWALEMIAGIAAYAVLSPLSIILGVYGLKTKTWWLSIISLLANLFFHGFVCLKIVPLTTGLMLSFSWTFLIVFLFFVPPWIIRKIIRSKR